MKVHSGLEDQAIRIITKNSENIQTTRSEPPRSTFQTKTFIATLVLILGSVFLLSSCERSTAGGENVEKRVAELEKQVTAIQQQNRDLRAKARAMHVFGRSPLGDFFTSPEFWQCTYDSSWSDCSSRCSKQTSEGYNACIQNHPEGPERESCVKENTERGANCLKNCPVQVSPLSPPDCAGGTGPA